MEGSGEALVLGNILIWLEGLRKTTVRSQDSQFRDQDSNWAPPKYTGRIDDLIHRAEPLKS
jgi:hypothetical protein